MATVTTAPAADAASAAPIIADTLPHATPAVAALPEMLSLHAPSSSVDDLPIVSSRTPLARSLSSGGQPACPPLSTRHFKLLKLVGKGAFGRVLQVRHIASGKIYAMKVIPKVLLQDRKDYVEMVAAERRIMSRLAHPYVVSLRYAFQSPEQLFLVSEFCAGGELFHHLRTGGTVLESTARVYLAQIVLALHYLHSQGIIHRDLKPENILLDADGHLKLTDYGLAYDAMTAERDAAAAVIASTMHRDAASLAQAGVTAHAGLPNADTTVSSLSHYRTASLCGTDEYLAPEMIAQSGGGYGKSVDWWSLGCLAVEMLTGKPPFRASKKEDLYRKILTERVTLPSYFSSACHSFIKGLLERNVEKRLGCGKSTMFEVRGINAVKQHPFFKGINWRALEARTVPAPIRISLSTEADTGNFDEYFTNQPATLEGGLSDDEEAEVAAPAPKAGKQKKAKAGKPAPAGAPALVPVPASAGGGGSAPAAPTVAAAARGDVPEITVPTGAGAGAAPSPLSPIIGSPTAQKLREPIHVPDFSWVAVDAVDEVIAAEALLAAQPSLVDAAAPALTTPPHGTSLPTTADAAPALPSLPADDSVRDVAAPAPPAVPDNKPSVFEVQMIDLTHLSFSAPAPAHAPAPSVAQPAADAPAKPVHGKQSVGGKHAEEPVAKPAGKQPVAPAVPLATAAVAHPDAAARPAAARPAVKVSAASTVPAPAVPAPAPAVSVVSTASPAAASGVDAAPPPASSTNTWADRIRARLAAQEQQRGTSCVHGEHVASTPAKTALVQPVLHASTSAIVSPPPLAVVTSHPSPAPTRESAFPVLGAATAAPAAPALAAAKPAPHASSWASRIAPQPAANRAAPAASVAPAVPVPAPRKEVEAFPSLSRDAPAAIAPPRAMRWNVAAAEWKPSSAPPSK